MRIANVITRTGATLFLAGSLLVIQDAAQAAELDCTGQPAACASSGAPFNFVVPTEGAVTFNPRPGVKSYSCGVGYDNSVSPALSQSFYWNAWSRMQNIRTNGGADVMAYEHEARFAVRGYTPDTSSSNNIPYFYQDTQLDDTTAQSVAAGSYDSYYLSPSTNYIYSQTLHACGTSSVPIEAFSIKSQRSYQNGSCAGGYEFCVTSKPGYPRDAVPLRAGYSTHPTTSKTYYWDSNRLLNSTYASSSSSWRLQAATGGTAAWAFPTTGGYEGGDYARFSCSTIGNCSMYQQTSGYYTDARDWYTAGVVLRCGTLPATATSCSVKLQVQSLLDGSSANYNVTIPKDGRWYPYELTSRYWDSTTADFRVRIFNRLTGSIVDMDQWLLHWTDNQ